MFGSGSLKLFNVCHLEGLPAFSDLRCCFEQKHIYTSSADARYCSPFRLANLPLYLKDVIIALSCQEDG